MVLTTLSLTKLFIFIHDLLQVNTIPLEQLKFKTCAVLLESLSRVQRPVILDPLLEVLMPLISLAEPF